MKLTHEDIGGWQVGHNFNYLHTYTREYSEPVIVGPIFTRLGMVHVYSEARVTSYTMVLDGRRYHYSHEHEERVLPSGRALSSRAWKFAKLVTEIVTGEPVD